MPTTSITEDELQKQVAAYLRVALPDGSVFHHSPNEGTRHVNFKMKPKGKLSYNQALLRDQFENLGLHWAMCCTLDEVVDFLSPIVNLKGGTRFINLAKNGETGRRVR